MNCIRCGIAEAVIRRDNAFYCARCVLARDWEEVIALVQQDRVEVVAAVAAAKRPDAAPSIEFDTVAPPNNGTPAVSSNGHGPQPFADPSPPPPDPGGFEGFADPFGG
jgi:hypothetical protein